MNFQMFVLVLEKAEEPEIKLPTSAGSSKKEEGSRKTSISALLIIPKPLTVWVTTICGKIWKRWEYQTPWLASWETYIQVRKQQILETKIWLSIQQLFQILKNDAVKVLHLICQQIWKTRQWPKDWKRSDFIPIPKKGNAKECSNCTIALISHARKVMLKILQARLQQPLTCEVPDVQLGFRKGRGTRDQIANIRLIIEKARQFHKNIYFCFIDYTKAFDCVDHHKLWKILKEMGIPDHLTCLLRNLYAGQEATVRTRHGTTHWFQIGKGVCQGYILSPCLFNLCAEYIMRNAGLESRLPGEISITSDKQMTPHFWQKLKN